MTAEKIILNPYQIVLDKLNKIENLLEKNLEVSSEPKFEKPVNVVEAAKYLGISIPNTYEKARKGLIPSKKNGQRRYFFLSQLDEYLRKQNQET